MSRRHCTGLSPSKADSHEDDLRLHRHPGVSPPPKAAAPPRNRHPRHVPLAAARGAYPQLQRPLRQGALVRLRAGRRGHAPPAGHAPRRVQHGRSHPEPAQRIRRRSSLPAPPDRLAARRLPAADPRRRGDSPPGADRLSARTRHRPRRGRSAARSTTPSANGVSSPSASATMPEAGSCAARNSRGAAPRNPSRPSTGTATRRCSSRASSTCSLT